MAEFFNVTNEDYHLFEPLVPKMIRPAVFLFAEVLTILCLSFIWLFLMSSREKA